MRNERDLFRLTDDQQQMITHWKRRERRDKLAFRQKWTARDVVGVFFAVFFALILGVALSAPTILKFEALNAFVDYLNRH